jgi:hypothetical protein
VTRESLAASVSIQVVDNGANFEVRGAIPVHAIEIIPRGSSADDLEAAEKRVREQLVNAALAMEAH